MTPGAAPPHHLRPGVSTSPSADELKRFALLVFDNVGLDPRSFGVNRINRLAMQFSQRMPNATFWAFFPLPHPRRTAHERKP